MVRSTKAEPERDPETGYVTRWVPAANPTFADVAAVANDFVWMVYEVFAPCPLEHDHDDQCEGDDFPVGECHVCDSAYGALRHIETMMGLGELTWKIESPTHWEATAYKDGRAFSRFFVNYGPIERLRPRGELDFEMKERRDGD